MDKLQFLESTAVPMPLEDIDTDQIIPARFLKATSREGFGKNLFRDWRYDAHNQPRTDFVLNSDIYSGEILIAGKNFGCGSSREHAVWALYDYGFRVVISSFFADIFKSNALNFGLLPIVVPEKLLSEIFEAVTADPALRIRVDLPNQEVRFRSTSFEFEIDAYKKQCLLEGQSDLDFLISQLPDILEFEKKHKVF